LRSTALRSKHPKTAAGLADRSPARARPRVGTVARVGPVSARAWRLAANAALAGGAALVAASGLIHLFLWADGYRNVTTIGPLFLVQAITGCVLAVSLVAYPRVLAAGLGVAYLLASIAALILSATRGLLGFRDTLNAPWAGTSLVVEAIGALLLVVGGILLLRQRSITVRRS
jgi:hypothetical protein